MADDVHRTDSGIDIRALYTGDDLADHTEHAYWLGTPDELKVAMFERDDASS